MKAVFLRITLILASGCDQIMPAASAIVKFIASNCVQQLSRWFLRPGGDPRELSARKFQLNCKRYKLTCNYERHRVIIHNKGRTRRIPTARPETDKIRTEQTMIRSESEGET